MIVATIGTVGVAIGLGLAWLTGDSSDAGPASASGRGSAATPLDGHLRLRVTESVLHPAATAAGRLRKRARLTVRLAISNGTEHVVRSARPVLISGRTRTPTDPGADGPGTRLDPLASGRATAVTLRFEVQEPTSTLLGVTRRGRILVAGRVLRIPVAPGNPVAVTP